MNRLLIAAACLIVVGCGDIYRESKRAETEYASEQFAASAERYRTVAGAAKTDSPLETVARFNLGTAHLGANEIDDAAPQLLQAAQRLARDDDADVQFKTAAYFNLGNAFYKQREYSRAVDTYLEALKLDADDRDLKHNLELALEQMEQQMSTGGSPDDDTPQPSPTPGDGDPEPLPQNPTGMSQEEAERLLDMLGGDDVSRQQRRLRNMLPPRRNVEKDW